MNFEDVMLGEMSQLQKEKTVCSDDVPKAVTETGVLKSRMWRVLFQPEGMKCWGG